MIIVTGAEGSVGRALCGRLARKGQKYLATDLRGQSRMDVTDYAECLRVVTKWQPHTVFHLAGFKQAPEAELDPLECSRVNIGGTANIVRAAGTLKSCRVIMTSTCKACDPETAYGASKLIAERIVLNAGGVVARFYNIPESDGNVFRHWESLEPWQAVPWTDCSRYFVSMTTSVSLLMKCMMLDSGRYAPPCGPIRHMREVATELYPKRQLRRIPRRRGDREEEPFKAAREVFSLVGGVVKIESPYDPLHNTICGGFGAEGPPCLSCPNDETCPVLQDETRIQLREERWARGVESAAA